ncbi:hypothetical protein [Elizabethkingia bruuniana]
MKIIYKSLLAMVCLTASNININAQQVTSKTDKLSMGKWSLTKCR